MPRVRAVRSSWLPWDARARLVTSFAIQSLAEGLCTPLRGNDPGSVDPGWIVSDVLRVPALQIRNPVFVLIGMKPDDLALHGRGLGAIARSRQLLVLRKAEECSHCGSG